MIRQAQMKYEIMQKDETPAQEAFSYGEEQRTLKNSSVTNDTTRPKLEGHLGSVVHKGERKAQCCTAHTI